MTTSIRMNDDTDYVHTAVVNYEPTYLVLANCAWVWENEPDADLAELREILATEVAQAAKVSATQIRELADDGARVVAGHDPLVAERFGHPADPPNVITINQPVL